MKIIGITGTDGKTTTASFIWQLLTLLGKKAGILTTVNVSTDGNLEFNKLRNTPVSAKLAEMFTEAEENGCEYFVIELVSQRLAMWQEPLYWINLYAAVMLDIKTEHLETHRTLKGYVYDKSRLFQLLNEYLPSSKGDEPFAVISAENEFLDYFEPMLKKPLYKYDPKQLDPLLSKVLTSEARHIGEFSFNVSNLLAAITTVSKLLNIEPKDTYYVLKKLKLPAGRMQEVSMGQEFRAIVDYAHTPGAFELVLPVYKKQAVESGGRLIVVYGSGGARHVSKRIGISETAAEYADVIILTDEDPRYEIDILETMKHTILSAKGFVYDTSLFIVPNRASAVKEAVRMAQANDVVLFLGKGHEQTIQYAGREYAFDEVKHVERAIARKLEKGK